MLPINALLIELIIPHELIIGEINENIASTTYTISKPFKSPYKKPPDLLNVLIIGKDANISAAKLTSNKASLANIYIKIIAINRTVAWDSSVETYVRVSPSWAFETASESSEFIRFTIPSDKLVLEVESAWLFARDVFDKLL